MTAIELLFFLISIGLGIGVGSFVAKFLGIFAGIVAGVLAVAGFVYLIRFWSEAGHRRHCRKMAEKYTKIFRIRVLPTDEKSIIKPKHCEIKVGDYGWESGPIKKTAWFI